MPDVPRPVRLRLSRQKGFRLQAASKAVNGLPAVSVGRPGRYGNPFTVGAPVSLAQALRWGWEDYVNPDAIPPDAKTAVRWFSNALRPRRFISGHNAFARRKADGRF